MEAMDPVVIEVIAISFVLGYSYLGLSCPQSNQEQVKQLQTHTSDKAAEAKTYSECQGPKEADLSSKPQSD